MNFSMQDTFNLGWKLAAVLRKQCAPELLHTYSAERQVVAQELIDFDREWAKMFSDRPKQGAGGETKASTRRSSSSISSSTARFTAGMGTHYRPSVICGEATHQHLATGFVIGTRFHSAPVVRVADARPVQLGHVGKADGRWRLYAFAGAGIVRPSSRARAVRVSGGIAGFAGAEVHAAGRGHRRGVRPARRFPAGPPRAGHRIHARLAAAAQGRYGLRDYEKVFCPD